MSSPSQYRAHEEYHIRRIEQQVLDALLRIEELMTRMVDKLERAFDTDLQEAADEAKRTKGKRRG